MSLLPGSTRILLGPGPSPTSPRVMRAMASPTVSHLDPMMLVLLDDLRGRLTRLFRASEEAFAFAVSGTGTSGMETAVANLVREGTRALVIVTGYTSINAVVKAELFPAHIRALGVGLPYALTVSVFGGTAEYVALWFKQIGHESWFYVYVTACVAASLLVYAFMRDTKRHSRIDRDHDFIDSTQALARERNAMP